MRARATLALTARGLLAPCRRAATLAAAARVTRARRRRSPPDDPGDTAPRAAPVRPRWRSRRRRPHPLRRRAAGRRPHLRERSRVTSWSPRPRRSAPPLVAPAAASRGRLPPAGATCGPRLTAVGKPGAPARGRDVRAAPAGAGPHVQRRDSAFGRCRRMVRSCCCSRTARPRGQALQRLPRPRSLPARAAHEPRVLRPRPDGRPGPSTAARFTAVVDVRPASRRRAPTRGRGAARLARRPGQFRLLRRPPAGALSSPDAARLDARAARLVGACAAASSGRRRDRGSCSGSPIATAR